MIHSIDKNKEASLRHHFKVKPAKRTENCFAKHWCQKKTPMPIYVCSAKPVDPS